MGRIRICCLCEALMRSVLRRAKRAPQKNFEVGECGSTHSTCPGFWDVRPTRADRSTATKRRVLTPLKHGSDVYVRYPWDRSEKPLPKFQVLRPLHFPLPTVPHRPTGGTVAIRPTFRITYSLRDRPDGTPRVRDRFPSRGNTLGRLSLAQGRPDADDASSG